LYDEGVLSFEPENIRWAGVLLSLIASSVAGTIFSNLITVQRSHNSPKLINDSLARHQLGYVSFYLTIGLVVGRSNHEWLNPVLFFLIWLSLIFFGVGLAKMKSADKRIQEKFPHPCPNPANPNDCDQDLPAAAKHAVFRTNLVCAALSFIPALWIALSPLVLPS
jgi:hypothetical protein